MQKSAFILSLVMIVSILFSSCGSSGEEKFSAYQCPMKCEGPKVYEKPGTCPVCLMELEGVK